MSSEEYGTGAGLKIVEDIFKEARKFQMIIGISLEEFNQLYLAGIINVEPVDKLIEMDEIVGILKSGESVDKLIITANAYRARKVKNNGVTRRYMQRST